MIMKNSVAKIYSDSLYEKVDIDQSEFLNSFYKIKNTIITKKIFEKLNSPVVSMEEKKEILDKEVISIADDALLYNFICVLIEKDRLSLIEDIFSEYKFKYNDKNNIKEVEVIYAGQLNENMKNSIKRKIKEIFGNVKFEVYTTRDDSLGSGFTIISDSVEYDYSYKGSLRKLEKILLKGEKL